ncbi:MAG: SRPBCC domain-containing protein [Pyrinomonadaceae bacterium]
MSDVRTAPYVNIKLLVLLLAIACVPVQAIAGRQREDNRLVHEGVVAAPVGDVWAAFTTGKGQESWMVAHSEVELKVGGRMRTHYDPKGVIGDSKTIENEIISYDPGRMLSIRVSKFPEGFPFPNAVKGMWTVIYFEALSPRTTRVQIVGLGFGDDEESKKMRAFFERGNAFTLKKLQERFAPKPSDK